MSRRDDGYRTLAENLPGLVYRSHLKEQGRMAYYNELLLDLTGFGSEELSGGEVCSIESRIHEQDRARVIRAVKAAIKENRSFRVTYRFLHKDGGVRHFWESGQPVMGDDGRPLYIDGFIMDVTEQQLGEEALRESEATFSGFFNQGNIGCAISLPGKGMHKVNAKLCDMLQYSEQELLAMNWPELTHPDDLAHDLAQFHRMFDGEIDRYEMDKRLLRKDGAVLYTHLNVSCIRGEDGQLLQVLATLQDQTPNKLAEGEKEQLTEQLLQSQKMEAVGQLAGGVAHDFNNMLSIILGNASLALMELKEGEHLQAEFSEILTAAERAKDLTMKLLTFARKEKLSTQAISVDKLMGELVKILDRTLDKRVRIETQVQGDPVIRADKNQMLQALINICNNAADAMPQGGILTFSCEQEHEEGVCNTCGESYAGTYCVIRISDTGVGMTEDVQRKVVEPFFTTKGTGKGTGLGLAVTHGIVVGHQGHMSVRSTPGKGSCFTILLPAVAAGDLAQEREAQREQLTGGNEKILVVDDEVALLRLAARVLARAGYQAIQADNGQRALELFRQQQHEISAVVLDMIMPGMGGAELFNELKKIAPEVKVILSSGYSEDGQAGQLMKQGIRAFIQKPFSMETLCQTVRDVLDS